MISFLRKISILFFLCCTQLVVAQSVATDTLDDESVRRWFAENEILADSLPVLQADSADVLSAKDSILPLIFESDSSLFAKLVSPAECDSLRKLAAERLAFNPLFFDEWVKYEGCEECGSTEELNAIRSRAKRLAFAESPEIYAFHESQLPNIGEIKRRRLRAEKSSVQVGEIPTIKIDKLNKIKPVFSPWRYEATAQIQLSQNFYTQNWHTGGESSLSANIFGNVKIKYHTDKVEWDNELDLKMSFNSAPSDTLRKVRANDDLLKLTSKIGIQAFRSEKWFYSADFELSTTLFNNYVKNSYERTSGPLSPLKLYLSAGFDFKYKKLSILLLPFSYKMLHVADTTKREGVSKSIAEKQGLPPDMKTKNDVGSKIKLHWEHDFLPEIKVETTLMFYTNYRGVEFDWEIIGNFIINRFLSARLSLNPRYDSTIKLPDNQSPELQFKELLSVGFRYRL